MNITKSRRRRFLLIVLTPLGFLVALFVGQSIVAAGATEMVWLASLAWAIPGWRWFTAEQGGE